MAKKNKRKRKNEEFKKGDAFIEENTGSATLINLDGQWEHDFVDDDTPAGNSSNDQKNNIRTELKKNNN